MRRTWKNLSGLALCVAALALGACVSPSGDTKEEKRASAMQMHDEVLSRANAMYPGLQAEIDAAPGYGVLDGGVVKILIIGTANGYGVIVDKAKDDFTVVDNFSIAVGPGIEVSNSNSVIVFHTAEALAAALDGDDGWDFGASAMLGFEFGDFGGDVSTNSISEQSSVYRDMHNGIGIHASVFWLDSDPDEDLN